MLLVRLGHYLLLWVLIFFIVIITFSYNAPLVALHESKPRNTVSLKKKNNKK